MTTKELFFTSGRYTVCLATDIPNVSQRVDALYRVESIPYTFCDFHIRVCQHRSLDNFFLKQAKFTFSERCFFSPLPYEHAFPLLEWGLNWCITNHLNNYLFIHAAVLAQGDSALILPGAPGSGKSTLCAALAFRSTWRLLSDELTLYNPQTQTIAPNPRPVALKDGSIDIIKKIYPDLNFTQPIRDTHKGTIAYLRPPTIATDSLNCNAAPKVLIFPRYGASFSTALNQLHPADAMMRLAEQTFNYGILGSDGFKALNQFVRQCRCYELIYDGNLDDAIERIETLMR